MSDHVERISLTMVRKDLEGVGGFAAPEPYFIRSWQPGDEKNWYDIHLKADLYSEITPELFEEQFGCDARELAARQLYLCDGQGRTAGTATAWVNEDFPAENWGRVHWVAILPELQGRGLAKPLLCACLERLAQLGYDGAYLTTSAVRVPALNLYLRFAFEPHIAAERDAQGWRFVRGLIRDDLKAAVDNALQRAR